MSKLRQSPTKEDVATFLLGHPRVLLVLVLLTVLLVFQGSAAAEAGDLLTDPSSTHSSSDGP